MSVDKNSNPESLRKQESNSFFEKNWAYIALLLITVNVYYFFFYDSDSFYGPSNSVWYADFRFWPNWVQNICWMTIVWAILSFTISLFIPKNEDKTFFWRRSFYQKTAGLLYLLLIWGTWYNHATLSLIQLFAPVISPTSTYIDTHYTKPLADYYTTGEGVNPLLGPIISAIILAVLFVSWRTWFYIRRWRRKQTTAFLVAIAVILPTALGADDLVPAQPKRVETSVGIYDVQSKDDLANFSAAEIRELVKMEDDRTRGAGKTPHPILVYCFEERSFQYTGGKYENAETKYRLRVPQKIVPGKKYPLIIHLHGVGEAGNDNTLSLAHLHSVLPLMVGPEQQDFFLLVTQCPSNNRYWEFSENKDGNLDVMLAALEDVKNDFPIDERRLSVFGLSSGGYGAWLLLLEYPEKFSAAAIASISVPDSPYLAKLTSFPIWAFRNKSDSSASVSSNRQAMRIINGSGGYMKLTQFDQGGHAAWRAAMDEYNCFSWMIAQKRGGWFSPPPERKVYTYRSMSNCFFAFFLPLGLAAGLLIFQRSPYCERLHEKIAEKVYRSHDVEYENDEDDDDIDDDIDDDENGEIEVETVPDDGFRMLTDITGTKKIKAKVVGFQGGNQVRIQSLEGKIAMAQISQFCATDQELMLKLRGQMQSSDGFREWTDKTGKQTFTAKFIGFQSDGKVLLQSKAGKTIPVPVYQLGQAEREFLSSQREQATAKPLPNGFREWTDVSETKKIVAKLLGFQDDKARFELQGGQVIVTPIHQFAAEDQVLLTQRMNEDQPPT